MSARSVAWWVGIAVAATSSAALAEPIDGRKVAYVDPGSATVDTSTPMTVPAARKEGQSEDGLFDPFRIGAFTGVGFPRPVSIEGFIKIEKILGFGVEYSLLPDLTVASVDMQMSAIMGDIRVFPLENGFFIGIAAGHQHLSAVSTMQAPSQLGLAAPGITVDTWILNPRIGYLSTWSWGGTLGVDVGLQIPLTASTTSTIPSGIPVTPDPTGIANTFGKGLLPTVDLLRLGLLL